VLLGAVLAVTNGSTLTAGAAVSSNGGGESLCFGTVAVLRSNDSAESIIDQSTNLIVHTIGTGADPANNTYSGDGRYLFVGEYTGESIIMIDTSNNQIIHTFQLGEHVTSEFVSNDDGSIVWAAVLEDVTYAPHVRKIQTSDGSVLASFDGRADGLLLSPDGNTLWALSVDYPNTLVNELSAATLSLTSSTTVPAYYQSATLNSTGSVLYIADDINPGIGIAAFDTQSKSYTTLGPTIGIHSVAISPSDSTLYFVGGEFGSFFLYILDIAAGTWTQHLALASTTAGGWIRGSRVTADGSKLFITNDYYAQGGLVVVETANPDTATFIPMQVSAPVAVCPLLADPAAPSTTTSTTTAATDPVAPAFTG